MHASFIRGHVDHSSAINVHKSICDVFLAPHMQLRSVAETLRHVARVPDNVDTGSARQVHK